MASGRTGVTPAKLQYMVAPPPASRRDGNDESGRYFHVLSEADVQLQEMEAQRILDRVRAHAAAHRARRTWGAAQPPEVAVRRSLSRPLMTPTVADHTVVMHEPSLRPSSAGATAVAAAASVAVDAGASGLLTLAPSERASGMNRAQALTTPLRPGTTPAASSAGRPASAALRSPMRASAAAGAGPRRVSAQHVTKLEDEVSHLRQTVDMLLAAQPDPKRRAAALASASSDAAASGVKADRSRLERAVDDHSAHMTQLENVLDAARASEERVLELEQERRQLAVATNRIARKSGVDVRSSLESDAAAAAAAARGESKEDGGGGAEGKEAEAGEGGAAGASAAAAPAAAAGARPASAHARLSSASPASRAGVTRTQDYSFMAGAGGSADGKHDTIARRRAMEEQRKREEELRQHLEYKFKAKDIPASTRLPLFGMIMARMETKRRLKHEARHAELTATMKPFANVMQHEEQMAARMAAARARQELATAKELEEGRKFRGNPVPPTIQNPDSEYMMLLAREKERPARVAQHSRMLAASASLPPRMALADEAEKKKRAERAAKLQQEARATRALSAFAANDMPEFEALHARAASTMAEKRKSFAPTTPTPFRFDSEARKAAERQRQAERRMAAELATSQSHVLRSRSASVSGGAGLDLGATGGSVVSAFALGATRGAATSRSLDREQVAEKLAASSAPPAAMTRTVQLRMLDVQRRVREQQAAERRAAEEEEERYRRLHNPESSIAPIVARMEAERVPVPLSWQMDAVTASASHARKRFEAESARRERQLKQRIDAAERTRPLLMLRSSMESQREGARRAALVQAATSVAGVQVDPRTSWQRVARDGGVGGAEMFDDDDRELMDVSHVLPGAHSPAAAAASPDGGSRADTASV